MQYRGIEIAIVQTIAPRGWRWSVDNDQMEKAGTSPDRNGAIRLAQKFIDRKIDQLHQRETWGRLDGRPHS
jgi:hypothetical protein